MGGVTGATVQVSINTQQAPSHPNLSRDITPASPPHRPISTLRTENGVFVQEATRVIYVQAFWGKHSYRTAHDSYSARHRYSEHNYGRGIYRRTNDEWINTGIILEINTCRRKCKAGWIQRRGPTGRTGGSPLYLAP